jgi:signal transduction histidine kinase
MIYGPIEQRKASLAHQLQQKISGSDGRLKCAAPISADPDLLQQVFINLYSNSLQALGPSGVIKSAPS